MPLAQVRYASDQFRTTNPRNARPVDQNGRPVLASRRSGATRMSATIVVALSFLALSFVAWRFATHEAGSYTTDRTSRELVIKPSPSRSERRRQSDG